MRQAFAHDAVLEMEPDADLQAPGGTVTAALCGHWDHEPPCTVAPHHGRADRHGSEVHVRILFAVEPGMEAAIRQSIESALAKGLLQGPDGVVTRWQLRGSRHSEVRAEEMDHAERLIRT